MTKEENIIVPRWILENIENTLRIQNNINLDKKTGETCQDRNIRQSLNEVRKLLNGEGLTGMERLEKLQPSLPSNLEEAAEEYAFTNWEDNDYHEGASEGVPFDPIGYTEKVFKAGAEWMAGQGITEVSRLYKDPNPPHEGLFFGVLPFFSTIEMALNYQEGEEVIVQIRKKQ